MSGRLRRTLDILLHVEDTPHRTALAFGIGVYIAFFPILGIHTGLALAIAFLFRLGRVPILLGAYVNNPWTLAPMYMAGTLLGCFVLSVAPHGLGEVDWHLTGRAFYRTLFATLRPYLWPFVLGNTVLGLLGGIAGYFALRLVLERRCAAAGG
ncbi:MAG: DUF2062 domain-containing protein [Acidobacteria bacterium]|nr:DUF2062 domain-containing protein [Acidobacteriota bacterium]